MDILGAALAAILGLVALVLAWSGRCLGLVVAFPLLVLVAVLLIPLLWLGAALALLLYLLSRRR